MMVEHRDQHLPRGQRVIDPGQPADPNQIYRHEEDHQQDRHHDPGAAQGVGRTVVPAVGEAVGGGVLDHRQHLDRGDRGRLDVGEPPERGAGQASEGVVREPAGASGDREQPAQLGVHQGQHQDDERGDAPRDDHRGPGNRCGGQRAEQPPRADQRALRGPQQAEKADPSIHALGVQVSLRAPLVRRGHMCHVSPSPVADYMRASATRGTASGSSLMANGLPGLGDLYWCPATAWGT